VPRLGVNIDHVATLRQARGGTEPDPVAAAVLVELAGADGLVVHLREDRRHIQDRDLTILRQTLQTKLDLEIAADEAMVKIALTVKPHLVTLVPERRQELTTEGGLEIAGQRERIKTLVDLLHDGGIPVSLFIEPDLDQVKAAHKVAADYVELHTGRYANARLLKEEQAALEGVAQAAKLAYKFGMGVSAGHGLTYRNVKRLTQIQEIVEYNIGHSIISRAVFVGLDQAVREMKHFLT
jgi:pyridoxine 5-phosphate synthase